MFAEYIQAALERAQYKIIEDEEPYFATVPELPGVWASGKTIEECRKELISVIEGWVLLRLKMGRSIPPIGGITIRVSTEPVTNLSKYRGIFGKASPERLEELEGEAWL